MYINVLTSELTVTMETVTEDISMVTSVVGLVSVCVGGVDGVGGGGGGGGGSGGGGGDGGFPRVVVSKKIIKVNNRIRNKWS